MSPTTVRHHGGLAALGVAMAALCMCAHASSGGGVLADGSQPTSAACTGRVDNSLDGHEVVYLTCHGRSNPNDYRKCDALGSGESVALCKALCCSLVPPCSIWNWSPHTGCWLLEGAGARNSKTSGCTGGNDACGVYRGGVYLHTTCNVLNATAGVCVPTARGGTARAQCMFPVSLPRTRP